MRLLVLLIVAAMVAAAPAEARTRSLGHSARAPHAHVPRPHVARPHRSRSSFRTVRIRRADGQVMTGYRDSLGTHLRGPDGRNVECQRQIGAADIDVACR